MNCWHCGSNLIWGADHTFEDYDIVDEEGMVSNFSCPNCPATVLVYLPLNNKKGED